MRWPHRYNWHSKTIQDMRDAAGYVSVDELRRLGWRHSPERESPWGVSCWWRWGG
jgi:hypothetical protein